MNIRTKALVGVILSTTLMACSSDDDDTTSPIGTQTGPTIGDDGITVAPTEDNETEQQPGTASVDTSAIAGFWDVTDIVDDEEDVGYIEIRNNGTYTVIDYDGDAFDGGDDCYELETGNISIVGSNQYIFTIGSEIGDADDSPVTIIRNGNTLNVSYVDESDEDEDGDITEILTENYPLLEGIDPTFNECV